MRKQVNFKGSYPDGYLNKRMVDIIKVNVHPRGRDLSVCLEINECSKPLTIPGIAEELTNRIDIRSGETSGKVNV